MKQRVKTVIVECPPQVARLVATCPGVDQVVARGEPLPKFDVYAPLLSVPGILGTSLETIPARVPYLSPDVQEVAAWQQELAGERGLKIGIAWRGSPGNTSDRWRSFPVAQFAEIAAMRDVRLYSLQWGPGREELTEPAGQWPIVDLGDRLGDFQTTAAIVRNLDLVITWRFGAGPPGGAPARKFGWRLPFVPDWRWMLGREDSPWYPTMRLFRQTAPGDRPGVFARIRQELARLT